MFKITFTDTSVTSCYENIRKLCSGMFLRRQMLQLDQTHSNYHLYIKYLKEEEQHLYLNFARSKQKHHKEKKIRKKKKTIKLFLDIHMSVSTREATGVHFMFTS